MSAEKETYIRRRAFNKIHVNSWLIYLEKDGFVRCPFQNCNFMAFDVNEMCEHYGFCKGDSSFANYVCDICKGCTVSEKKLQEHRARAHNITILSEQTETTAEADKSDPGKPSRVMVLSWGVFFEKHKYIKCSNCQYLANTMSEICRHFTACKQERKFLVYVCPECKGRSNDVGRLIQHLERAHTISKRPDQFNHISRNMVQFWEKELREEKYATCLHINSAKERDCEFIDVDLFGINEHSQMCKGPQQVTSSKQWYCQFCLKWTTSYEKLTKHQVLSHRMSLEPSAQAEQKYSNPPQNATEQKQVLNNLKDSARSQQFSRIKKFVPFQNKNATGSYNKEPLIQTESIEKLLIVEGEYSGENSRENSNTFEKHVKVFNVDNPDTIVPDMLAEECPFTICDTNQRSKEIFLDLVEDKLVARQSVNTILVKDLDNIFEKEVCKNQDSSMVNMGTGVRSPDTFIRSEAGPQTIENFNVEEDKLTVTNNGNNTAYYSASEERKSGIVCEETDFGEKCIVNSSNYLKNSIPSEPNHDNIILPHDYKCKKFLEQHSGKHNVSLKLYQDEIEVEDNIFTKVEDRVKEESREEDIVSVGSENIRENLSKSNKHPCHVLFKDEPSSDEEELSEKSDVEEDIKNLSVDWYSGNRYNNKSPKNYTRRKSSEDRSPPKKSGYSLCKESDPSQSSIGSEDIGRTSVINYRGKKSYENNFKNQMQATKNVAFQSRAHFDESQEEASKNSEKNDKLMLQEHSCDSLSNITLKSSDQIQTSIPIIELSQREGRTSKIELFSKFAHTINEKVVESEGKSKQTSFDRKTFSLDSKTVEEVCYKQGSGTINSILCEYELRGNCEKDESKLLNDTLNLEKAVQETASKSQTCVDSGDDSLEVCEETKCLAKQSSSVNSYSLQINKSIAENKIAEIKPRVVSFFYSGKLMKPISVTDSPKNKKITEDSEKSMRLEVLRNTLFSNKPKPNCFQNQIVGEPIKHKEEENPSQQLKMVTKTSTVHENDGVVDSNSKFSVMSQIQSDFNVDSSVEEARNTIFVETSRSLPDVGHVGIESECSSEQIKTGTSSDVITIVKNADLLKENETYLGGNLKDRHISSDFNDNSPLDEENFLGTDEELDKDKFFNGFQEISENVYSTNRRFRQFLNRMSESENEEWYINAGNLSLDIRKDLSLSHDKLKNPTSFEYDPPIISNEKLIFVVEDNNPKKKVFASSCKEFVNANVENSKPSLQANQEITGEEIHCSNIPKIDKEEEIIKNHNAIGSGLNKQEDLVKNVTNKINSLLSSSKESNITAPLNIATKRSFKISLSIDNLKMPSKIGTEKLSPQKLDKINIYEPTEGIRNANKKGVRSSSINRESVEEDCLAIKVKPDSYNLKNHPKNIKSNRSSHPIETSNSKSSLLTTTTADQSSSIDEPVGNLNRDIVLNASAILRKRDQKNTEIEKNKSLDAKAKDKKENVLVKEMKATIFDKCNNRKQTESNTNPNKASKHYDYVPASNISSNSQLKISKDECSNQVIKRVHSNFLGATVSSLPLTLRKDKVNVEKSTISTSIGYKYSEDKDKHKFKSDDMTQSDNETLSDVQEVGHSSVKTVLCAKDNLLTEGFSPHDHILEESFENEKMKSAMEDNLVTEGLSPHELIQDESLKTEKMKSAKEAHLETIKLDMKTGQHYANTINSDVYNSKKINSIIKSRDSNITTKKVRRQESYKDERGIKAFVNETTEMDTEKLCETASVGLSDKNVNITDNCTAEEQSSSVLYSKNSFALDKGMNPEYCTTPKRRGRPPKRKLNEITAIADQNEESNNFNEDDYDNELLLSIYSEDVEKILVCGLFEENQDKNLQYRMGLPEFQNGGKIEQALTKSIKDVLPNKQKEVEDDSASGPSEMKIPKKRGRKPKLKSEINTSKDADNTQAFSTVLLDGKAECTRKSTDSSADKSCDISEIKVPKRRGRPPKLKTEISSSQCIPDAINQSTYEKFNVKNNTCKDLLSHSNTDIACDINEVKIPKKRGRKPKLKTQRDNSVSSQNTTESPLKEVQDETVLNGMVKESTTGKLCDVEIVKVPKKRGRPRIKKPESLENGTSSIFEKRDRSNRYSKINSDVHDEANEVSSIADIDCDSSVANELLDTDVIMINEEKLRRSLTLDRKSRKCKVTPEKSVTNDDDQSDGSRSEESFSSDDSEDDMSYRQPPKRRKKDTIQKSSDGNIETVCKLENKNRRSNVKNSVEKTFFKTKHHGNDKVVCGACKTEMTYSTYRRQHAIFKHYMLTWLEGEESPMDMNNQRDIESRLWFCKKQMRRTPFRCPVCNLPKLSAVGFYSHIRFCGKDHEEKKLLLATCDICGTKMMPCSLKAHMNSKHSDKPSEEASKSRRDVLDQSLIVRGPRAAATRAVQVIQKSQADNQDLDEPGSRASSPDKESQLAHLYTKPSNSVSPLEYRRWKDSLANNRFVACTMEGCNFSASTTIQFRKHYITCPFRPPRLYKCRNCDFTSANHEQMLVHVEKKHVDQNFYQPQGSEDDSSEGSDDEQKPTKVSYSGSILPFKFLKLAKLARQRYASTKRFFTPAMTWTFELRQKMFARETLYPEALCKPVKAETVCTHLPELTESISFHGSDGAWQRLQRFQSCLVDGVPILFAGGPVWATSWAPVPHPEEHQYLAVAAHTSVEITHKMSSLYNYPGLIQIWALGALSNTHTGEVSCPRLVVGLAQQRGPVWSLAWCPSGAYTQDRLGLLAAACGDGSVVVYAVPRVAPTHTTSEPVMSVKPTWEMKLGCEMMAQCTCVEWHTATPHSVIAGGFTNGMVALWDLTITSPLLKSGSAILPFKVIEAHHSAVTSVKLSCTAGNVYMMTASLDRTTKFWNLDDTRSPVSYLRKACVTDAVMTNNWLLSISAYDDVYSINNSHVTGCTFRDFFTTANSNFVLQPGTVWALSFNDWLNGCAYASEMGKVNAFFRQQLLATEDFKKVSKTAFIEDLVTCTSRSVKDGSTVNSGFGPEYQDCASSVGLAFDFRGQPKDAKTSMCSSDNMDSYPIRSFNTVSWNQNTSSFTWLAAGMQCGLVVVPRLNGVDPNDLTELDQLKDNL